MRIKNSNKIRIRLKNLIYVCIQLIICVGCIAILPEISSGKDWDSFIAACRFGLIVCIGTGILLILQQKKMFTMLNIAFLAFVLFQFGVPIIYAVNPDYSSYYTGLFTQNTLIFAAQYTIISISFFAFASSVILTVKPYGKTRETTIFSNIRALQNNRSVRVAGLFLVVCFGVIILPLYTYVALLSVINGFSQATRGILSSSPLFNLARGFFMPACFLVICYSNEKDIWCRLVKCFFFVICAEMLVIGTRAEGVTWLVVYFYDKYTYEKKRVKKRGRGIKYFALFALLGFVAVYIAITRNATQKVTVIDVLKTGLFENFVGEMGFNFYSLCFVLNYVPEITDFQHGLTYINSFLALVPSTLDFSGTIEELRLTLPVQWLYDLNHQKYGELLDFGVGFSFVAETYLNFGKLGTLASMVFVVVFSKLFVAKKEDLKQWERYVQLAVLMPILTFPRRSILEALQSIEYSVFFMALYLTVFYKFFWKYSDRRDAYEQQQLKS